MAYSGFFVREYLGQLPNQPPSGPWTQSPDVVFSGKVPADSQQYVTAQGYATDYGSYVFTNVTNFVYPRALNAQSQGSTGRVWFFWVDSSLALWPQNWRGDLVTVSGQQANFQPIAASSGDQISVVNQPFEWTPPPPPTTSGHYVSIVWVENNPADPPVNPFQGLAPFPTFEALAQYVLSNPNMGLRGVVNINGQAPTWTQTTPVVGPSPAQPFYLGIQCNNMPTDGMVGFSVPGPVPTIPPIVVPLSPIVNPNMSMTVQVDWPAGAQSSITVIYQMGPTQPPAGASITVVMYLAPEGATKATTIAF
jgi:hypothetical protein